MIKKSCFIKTLLLLLIDEHGSWGNCNKTRDYWLLAVLSSSHAVITCARWSRNPLRGRIFPTPNWLRNVFLFLRTSLWRKGMKGKPSELINGNHFWLCLCVCVGGKTVVVSDLIMINVNIIPCIELLSLTYSTQLDSGGIFMFTFFLLFPCLLNIRNSWALNRGSSSVFACVCMWGEFSTEIFIHSLI